ncbi:hypothetical protein E3N88_26404 [Mikania micrantha]|uniref:Uncharacterized protein n=1 Tax=Mikania micrantha TaxID=192012 RepID=A0A5N6N7H0_9ASTR|nr:hypothetical protein E3N88_26404 [Mikania micrantha]
MRGGVVPSNVIVYRPTQPSYNTNPVIVQFPRVYWCIGGCIRYCKIHERIGWLVVDREEFYVCLVMLANGTELSHQKRRAPSRMNLDKSYGEEGDERMWCLPMEFPYVCLEFKGVAEVVVTVLVEGGSNERRAGRRAGGWRQKEGSSELVVGWLVTASMETK